MDSSSSFNCAVRVKEEPSDISTSENNCEVNAEKSNFINVQLLPILRENLTHEFRKCDGNQETELSNEMEIVFECEDAKPKIDSFIVKKGENYSPNQLQNVKGDDVYKGQTIIKIEPANEEKQEFFTDNAEQLKLNLDSEVQQKKNKNIKKKNNIKPNLKTHISAGHNDTIRSCDTCGNTFSLKGNLKKHIDSVHYGIKHTCLKCGKTFSHKSNFKKHIDSVHNGITSTCDICGKTFSHKSNLKKHIDSVHNGITPTCDICGKTFSYKYNLIAHMDTIHIGITHACDICGKKFSYKYNLKAHMDTIHIGITHACDICGKKFSQKSNLKKH